MSTVDPLYVAARRVLLDALYALGRHRRALVLVGAQAVYLRAGQADLELSITPFTTDADLGVQPELLGNDPRIIEAMTDAGFTLKVKGSGGVEPGIWLCTTDVAGEPVEVAVDLLVPEALAPLKGRRDARLPEQGKNATRWTPGLEACVIDNNEMTIISLEPENDARSTQIRVAGTAALLVAKAHKISERVADRERGRDHRLKPKDAGDVIRLMSGSTSPVQVGERLAELAHNEVCGPSVRLGVAHLQTLFGARRARGVDLGVTALAGARDESLLRDLAPAYVDALMARYRDVSTLVGSQRA